MVFEDIFYPGNARKRKEVSDYQIKFQLRFNDFKKSWNTMCTSFNNAVQRTRPDWILQRLDYTPDSQKADDILNGIKSVMEDTKDKIPKMEHDLGIKDIAGAFEKRDAEKFKKISTALTALLGTFETVIVIHVLKIIFKHVKPICGIIVASVRRLGGVIGFILGGFVATLVASVILGAIESKKLGDAIEEFRKFDEDCIEHLEDMRRKIDGINQNIVDGIYKINDYYFIQDRKLKEDIPVGLQKFSIEIPSKFIRTVFYKNVGEKGPTLNGKHGVYSEHLRV
ncbi:8302_t:CDS:2 [Paraglomus brasilianum]|uniref:8302_t:CDS:1 n=1 Tax=Paraglomus brasilianum TaxID=144538 RepID=A0A9N8WCA7_9GLOM|nr:8302_t:CDS:2 [Paraglomus brasilianum]